MYAVLAPGGPSPSGAAELLRFLMMPAVVRQAGDIRSISAENQLGALLGQRPLLPDTWMDETLGYIHKCQEYEDGWDGADAVAPEAQALSTAEYLTAFFAGWPVGRRPKLAIDFDGRPTFASKSGDFYLHLTVTGPDRLTWYATKGDSEYFEEDSPFDGTALPQALAQLAV